MKKKIVYIILGLMGICLLFFIFDFVKYNNESDEVKAARTTIAAFTQQSIPTETPIPPTGTPILVDPISVLQTQLTESMDLTSLNYDPTSGVIEVVFAIADNFSMDDIRFGAKMDTGEVLNLVYHSGLEFNLLKITGTFILIDEYGNESVANVLNLQYSRETLDKINWDNLPSLIDHIYELADQAGVHRELQDQP